MQSGKRKKIFIKKAKKKTKKSRPVLIVGALKKKKAPIEVPSSGVAVVVKKKNRPKIVAIPCGNNASSSPRGKKERRCLRCETIIYVSRKDRTTWYCKTCREWRDGYSGGYDENSLPRECDAL